MAFIDVWQTAANAPHHGELRRSVIIVLLTSAFGTIYNRDECISG
jgi:hypothetical protein